MSEYQYYEFVAVDQPLTATQQRQLRAVSTRARITPSSFVNDYEWGDLKGDPHIWMERYFDVFLYLANWGTRRVALRLPIGVLEADIAAAYCVGDSARSWATRTHVILDLWSEDEDGDELWTGEGRLASIVPARAEPSVPPGLSSLSGPLQSLIEFLRLDQDLLASAAEASPSLGSELRLASGPTQWVRALPMAEKDEILVRLLNGEATQLRTDLLTRFHAFSEVQPTESPRTAGALLAAAEARRLGVKAWSTSGA